MLVAAHAAHARPRSGARGPRRGRGNQRLTTGTWQVVPKGNDVSGYYEAQLGRLSANFAFCADLGLTMGGGLKTAEFISGRSAAHTACLCAAGRGC